MTGTSAAAKRTEISPGRYSFELSLETQPERVLADLAAAGASLVSLNPLQETLEDFFVQRVAETGAGARQADELEASSGRH